jgi:hypothetical protein
MKFYRKICDILYWHHVTAHDPSFHVRLLLFFLYFCAICGYIVVFDIDGIYLIRKRKQLFCFRLMNKSQFTFEQLKKILSPLTVDFFVVSTHFTPSSENNYLNPILRL